jgi:hypothetical protein
MSNTPITADLDGLVERDHTFCSVVWEALKGDHNDLRKEAIILRAFRAVIAALPSPDLDGPCPICKGIEGCSHTVLERMSATITALRGEVDRLEGVLDIIAVYGSDTLSGPSEPVTDRLAWYRDGVREMVKRAQAALASGGG